MLSGATFEQAYKNRARSPKLKSRFKIFAGNA